MKWIAEGCVAENPAQSRRKLLVQEFCKVFCCVGAGCRLAVLCPCSPAIHRMPARRFRATCSNWWLSTTAPCRIRATAMQLRDRVMPPDLKQFDDALQKSGLNENHDVDQLAFALVRPSPRATTW